jgi:hypothetical protein
VLALGQNRCTVHAKHTIGSDIHLMIILGDEAQVVARFDPFGDSANLDAILVHGLGRT